MAREQFYIKQNDDSPALQATLKDGAGNAVDVTGATVVFSMAAGGIVKVNRQSVTLTTPASGIVTYSWQSGDTDTPGNHTGEFEVTFVDGTVQTYPNSFDERLEIVIGQEIA